jgi:hypothetical protein
MLRRILTYASESGDIPVPITIDTPRQGERDWSCTYEIGWPDETRRHTMYGIDAMQAMLIALKIIGAEIYTSDLHRSDRLRWLEAGDGYGYPVPKGLRDLLVGSDAEQDG